MASRVFLAGLLAAALATGQHALPNQHGSLKFLVAGNTGTGEAPQYDVAKAMAALRGAWRFTDVIMLGNNIYGSERPGDYVRKFETPYAPLLNDGVSFRAVLGEEDEPEQRFYKHFNMAAKRHYTWRPGEHVRLFFLDSTDKSRAQTEWLEQELSKSSERWKIAVFHQAANPAWDALFIKHNVNVALSGHDAVYARSEPQRGPQHFIVGSSGKVDPGALRNVSPPAAAAFDRDNAFMAVEIDRDTLHFQAISRTGAVVDSGAIKHRGRASTTR